MRLTKLVVLVPIAFAVAVSLLLLLPRHIHEAGGRAPSPNVTGEALRPLRDQPASVLDCGSVVHHGPDWNSEGGTCNGALTSRFLQAELVGAVGAAGTLITIGVAMRSRRRLPAAI